MSERFGITETTPLSVIRDQLRRDGYASLVDRAEDIRRAATHGCLSWTLHRIDTTDSSRISELSELTEGEREWLRGQETQEES